MTETARPKLVWASSDTISRANPKARQVRWTANAIDDLRFWRITKGEWQAVRREIERIAALHNLRLDSAVCSIAQCDHLWLRLKIVKPSQIRVAFTEEGEPPRIVIQAVLRRSQNTYKLFEIVFKAKERNIHGRR